MTLRNLIAVTLAASALLLAACGSDNNGGPMQTTVPALAASTISNDTCVDNAPQGINTTTFIPDDSTVTDVTRLTPGCNSF
jgi:hypothetical protein